MSKVFIITGADIKEAFHSRTTYFYIAFLLLISLPYLDGFRSVIGKLTAQGVSETELRLAMQSFLNSVISTLPLVLTMLFCSFLSGYSIIMDKAKHTLESLLATSLSLRQIWMGKSLAIVLPSIAITLLVSLLVLLAINSLFIIPVVGGFVIPSALSWITGLIIIPVMTFFVVLIVSFLQLIMANPRIANFGYIALFLGIYFTTVTEVTASWDFSLVYLMITLLLAVVTLFLNRFLTKEKVVLSSKG